MYITTVHTTSDACIIASFYIISISSYDCVTSLVAGEYMSFIPIAIAYVHDIQEIHDIHRLRDTRDTRYTGDTIVVFSIN